MKACFQPPVCGSLLHWSQQTSMPPLLSLPLPSASCTQGRWRSVLLKSYLSYPALTCGKSRQIRVMKSPKSLGCEREVPPLSPTQTCYYYSCFRTLLHFFPVYLVITWRLLQFSYNTLSHLYHLLTPYTGLQASVNHKSPLVIISALCGWWSAIHSCQLLCSSTAIILSNFNILMTTHPAALASYPAKPHLHLLLHCIWVDHSTVTTLPQSFLPWTNICPFPLQSSPHSSREHFSHLVRSLWTCQLSS